jgi:hypothetical protein
MSNFRQKTVLFAVVTAGLLSWQGISTAQEMHDLRDSRTANDMVAVQVTVATQGIVEGAKLKDEKKVEMSVRGQLAYHEKLVTTGADQVAVRNYSKATAQMVVGQHAETNSLDAQRNVVVASTRDNARIYSPVAPLTRQEFDLLNAPACSLAAYGLLPTKPVAIGSTWRPTSDQLAAVLRLEHVGVNQAQMKLVEVARGLARMQLTGSVKGSVDGATTNMLVTGDIRYDLRWKHLTWVQLSIQENRGEGPISIPYVARADVRMLIAPIEGDSDISAVPPAIARENPNQSEMLRYASESIGFELLHNSNWHLTGEQGRRATFRLIDKDKIVAQCNISRLTTMPTGKQLSLEEFQGDIRKALGEQFGEFESAKKTPSKAGGQTLRVSARGLVSEIPIRWIYYHVTDANGERAAYVFTLSDDLTEKFAGRDQLMVDSVQFVAMQTPSEQPAAETAATPPSRR